MDHWHLSSFAAFACHCFCDFLPVNGLDDIKQCNRFGCLVALQGPYEVKLDVAAPGAQARPFRSGLLHAVFTEQALSGIEDRNDVFGSECLGNGHQLGTTVNFCPDLSKIQNHIIHRPVMSKLAGLFKAS